MATALEEARAKHEELKKAQQDLWAKLSVIERTWRDLMDESFKIQAEANEAQEKYLESIGMPPRPTKEFLLALAEAVESAPCHIEHMLERGNSSRYDRPVAEKIYTKLRDEVPEVPAVAELNAKAQELRTKADEIEKKARMSEEYLGLRKQINELNWPIRVAREEEERCYKNEQAKERRQDQKADPSAKVIKATREKLNAILAGTVKFEWKR